MNGCIDDGPQDCAPSGVPVCVVDDDESVREALPDLLGELGFTAYAFTSAEEFLASDHPSRAECLILDIAMPQMSGPQLQEELKRRGVRVPIIFITAHHDEALFARLKREGAVACLLKPFSDAMLLEAVTAAVARQ